MKSIRIRRTLALAAGVCLVASVAATVAMGLRYSGMAVDAGRMEELERANSVLQGRIAAFEGELVSLKASMERNYELQNRARLLASLDPIPEDVWNVGIGGPEPELLEREMSVSDRIFSSLEDDLAELVRQSRLQRQSYDEICSILEQEAAIRDCTPSIRPLRGGFLSSRFGRRMDPFTGRISVHRGIDYHARTGTPVMATADGVITMARKNGSLGLVVEVNHGNGFTTRYGHLARINVVRGHRIKRGEIIGTVGNTGRSTGPHLHYEVLFRKGHRDPLQYIIPEDVYFD
ncbi:MAG: M23 family metallopeptidase [Candidatus Krumholzibacteria bacterium]|nr:M23 family metallopeptidase [Candidatus Krumholzibacteria bacterium]